MAISVNIILMKRRIKFNWSTVIVLFLATIFFVSTSSFNYLTQEPYYIKWTSPDETANYFFASRFSEGRALALFDEAGIIGDNMVMPRSFRSDFGWLKPVSFLGIIIIYGTLGSLIGTALIPFLTPLLAAFGIIIFYLLISKIYSERIGLISAALLTFFPVYIYYSVRSMFHNVLFIVLLLTSIYFLVLSAGFYKREKSISKISEDTLKNNGGEENVINQIKNESNVAENKILEVAESSDESIKEKRKKYKFFTFKLPKNTWLSMMLVFLGGVFFGLAVITRASELIWLVPACFIAWLFYAKRFSITKLILILAGFFLAVLPNIYYNQLLYSSPFYGGYNEMNKSIDDISEAGSNIVQSVFSGQEIFSPLKSIYHNVFYFGFNYEQSVEMAKHYIWEMFPFLLGAFLLGVLIMLFINVKHFSKKYLVYFSIFIIVSVILIFYYGSWQFNDNPDPNRFTIGNSYTRYWLPIYLMLMPIASLAIYRFSRAVTLSIRNPKSLKRSRIIAGIQIIIISIFAFTSIDFVLYGSEEGLVHLYYNNLREKGYTERVFTITEPDSVLITKYYDKFLFPQRRVIMGNIQNEEVLSSSSNLANYYPIYYFNFYLGEADVNYLNGRKLPKYNLEMSLVERISHDFGLYSLKKTENLSDNLEQEEGMGVIKSNEQ